MRYGMALQSKVEEICMQFGQQCKMLHEGSNYYAATLAQQQVPLLSCLWH